MWSVFDLLFIVQNPTSPSIPWNHLARETSGLLVWAYLFSIGYLSLWMYQRVKLERLDLDTKQVAALSLVSGGISMAVGVLVYYQTIRHLTPVFAVPVAVISSVVTAVLLGVVPAHLFRPEGSVSWEPAWRKFVDHYDLEGDEQSVSVLLDNGMKISGEIGRMTRADFDPAGLILKQGAQIEQRPAVSAGSDEWMFYAESADGRLYIPAGSISSVWVVED